MPRGACLRSVRLGPSYEQEGPEGGADRVHLPRVAQGPGLHAQPRHHSPRHEGRQHPAHQQRRGQAGYEGRTPRRSQRPADANAGPGTAAGKWRALRDSGLWCVGHHHADAATAADVHRHAVLDGARGDRVRQGPQGGLRHQVRRLGHGHHGDRDGRLRAAAGRSPPAARALPDPDQQAADAAAPAPVAQELPGLFEAGAHQGL